MAPKPIPRKKPDSPAPDTNELVDVHSRYFKDSIEQVKQIAAESGIPWQVELRLLVRRALRAERHPMLKE